MNPAVIGTDVVDRKVVDGVLHTHRLVSSKWGFPRWAQKVSFNVKSYFKREICQTFAVHDFIYGSIVHVINDPKSIFVNLLKFPERSEYLPPRHF